VGDPLLWAALVGVALLLVVGAKLVTSEPPPLADADEDQRKPTASPVIEVGIARPESAPSPDRMDEVRAELAAGRKIMAIKIHREVHGVGLKEAKQAVDAMEAGGSPPPVTGPTGSQASMDDVRAELARGRKIQAIKIYRELHRVSLKEAKDAVDALG
jgi:ribosomal protein L7/L12